MKRVTSAEGNLLHGIAVLSTLSDSSTSSHKRRAERPRYGLAFTLALFVSALALAYFTIRCR
jgi:hypothetical protein